MTTKYHFGKFPGYKYPCIYKQKGTVCTLLVRLLPVRTQVVSIADEARALMERISRIMVDPKEPFG